MTEKPDWWERAAAVIDPELPTFEIAEALLQDVWQHARECYPEEACGLLFGSNASTTGWLIERCRNVQNRRKAAGESNLDARHGFWIDEKELLDALKRADERGDELKVIYHSHVDTGAYLSHTDRDSALSPDAKPLWPGVSHLVVAVRDGVISETGCFVWNDGTGSFVGRAVCAIET